MRIQATQGILIIDGMPHPQPFPRFTITDLVSGETLRNRPLKLVDDETGEVVRMVERGSFLVQVWNQRTKKYECKLDKFVTKLKIEIAPCLLELCPICRRFYVGPGTERVG